MNADALRIEWLTHSVSPRGGVGRQRSLPIRRISSVARAVSACRSASYQQKGLSMPVMHFRIQWPDGDEANCYSPSQVVRDFFTPGHAYPLDDFVQRSREALNIASERVRQKYGFACSAAMDQLAQIERDAERFREQAGATVKVIELV
jgi:uncharacterized repeat protein (TIGR04042 family)